MDDPPHRSYFASMPVHPPLKQRLWLGGVLLVVLFTIVSGVLAVSYITMQSPRLTEIRERVEPGLKERLTASGLTYGDRVYIRIVKEERELELWLKPKAEAKYKLWKTWPVAAMSGRLGPKQKEGDLQAPEGFYATTAALLNPNSKYHLSFNIGYPNTFDRAHGRTGNFLMVHGSKVSIGCFAMTNPVIEEIYLIVEAALNAGQKEVPVHVFPFRMTDERMLQAETEESEWLEFWKDLRRAWVKFEAEQVVPTTKVEGLKYVVLE